MADGRGVKAVTAAAAAAALVQFAPAVAAIPGVTTRSQLAFGAGRHQHGLALTFDDGPHPLGTPAVLEVLATHAVTATFFLIAEQLRRYPDIGRRIVAEGHEVAVLGLHHTPLIWQEPITTRRNLAEATAVIADICQSVPRWFRPPYGIATASSLLAAHSLGLQPIWWTRWARDWSTSATADSIARRSTRMLRSSEVLLLHDSDSYGTPGSWRATAAALPVILRTCRTLRMPVGSLQALGEPAATGGGPTPRQ